MRSIIQRSFWRSMVSRFLSRTQSGLPMALRQMVRDGSRFLPGHSLQLGGSLVLFTNLPEGTLGFEEPNMSSMPIIRQSGLTNSLRHLRLQKNSLESVLPAENLAFPSLRQTCTICTKLAQSESFLMERQASSRQIRVGLLGAVTRLTTTIPFLTFHGFLSMKPAGLRTLPACAL